MRSIPNVLLAAAAAFAITACNKNDEADKRRVDEVKAEAKDVKDRAEKRTEEAKDQLDHKLEATKAAADRKVDEVKDGVDHARDEDRRDVRGRDDLAPDHDRWRTSWDRFSGSRDAKWSGDDDWVVERGDKGELRAHRRGAERPATKMDDGAVTEAVKGRFASNDEVRPSKIDVDTDDGVVTLKGKVPSRAIAGEALRLALGTKGVREVVSKLEIK
jgi:BON domain-containing protein